MTRKRAVVLVSCLAVLGGASAAGADAPLNDNNCAGDFASGLLPELASGTPSAFGADRSTAGRAGLVGDAEQEATGLLASCGTP